MRKEKRAETSPSKRPISPKKNKRWLTPTLCLMAAAGLFLLLYPAVSDYLQKKESQKQILEYTGMTENLMEESVETALREARAYNERLFSRSPYISALGSAEKQEYEALLNEMDTGIMGYLEIPKLDLSLPIYHGTSEEVLRSGVGHTEGSSLPVGGENVHTILSSHSGLPTAALFSHIDELKAGDRFILHVLNTELVYQVESVETVLPEALDALCIEEGRDQCTLVTCTPYGVNSHRLLVHGVRTEESGSPENADTPLPADEQRDGGNARVWVPLVFAGCAVLLGVGGGFLLLRIREKSKK